MIASDTPLRLSRSRLALFLDCPRCFHLAVRGEAVRPDMGPLTLNLAVDALMKREFDQYRQSATRPELLTLWGVDAVPLQHPELEAWRDFRRGVSWIDHATGIELYGAVDDIWLAGDGTTAVVDYKATSTARTISADDPRYSGYRRQLEVYHWLLRKRGLPMGRHAYLLFANADGAAGSFDAQLQFTLSVHAVTIDDGWVPDALQEVRRCLDLSSPPPATAGCEWCRYRRRAAQAENTGQAEA